MTHADFYLVLRQFEQSAIDPSRSEESRLDAARMLARVRARMAEMGLTREKLAELAQGNGSFVLKPGNRQYSRPPKRSSAAAL